MSQKKERQRNMCLENLHFEERMDVAGRDWEHIFRPGCLKAGGGGVASLIKAYVEERIRGGGGGGGRRPTYKLPYISRSPRRVKSAPCPPPFGLYGGRRRRRHLTIKRRRRSRAKRKKTEKRRCNRR